MNRSIIRCYGNREGLSKRSRATGKQRESSETCRQTLRNGDATCNHQGGLRSPRLHRIAFRLLNCAQRNLHNGTCCPYECHDPVSCPMPVILQFLQELLDAAVMLKVQ
ncbi:UNVERIFIED_CONTAM: hypothetical protein FKN15_023645 [Acipenser sinensis]